MNATASMTANDFRRMILAMTDVVEGAHHGHPDFRVRGKVVASLHENGTRGMVKVTLDQQAELVAEHPDVFEPEAGAWGRQGCTRVHFAQVDDDTLGLALTYAVTLGRNLAERPAPKRRRK